jgi:hypothetical protein
MDPLIYDIQVERGLHRPDVAMDALQRAASLVKPIMRAHNFKVGLLAEFLPKERGLLGKSIIFTTYSMYTDTHQVSTPEAEGVFMSDFAMPRTQHSSLRSR